MMPLWCLFAIFDFIPDFITFGISAHFVSVFQYQHLSYFEKVFVLEELSLVLAHTLQCIFCKKLPTVMSNRSTKMRAPRAVTFPKRIPVHKHIQCPQNPLLWWLCIINPFKWAFNRWPPNWKWSFGFSRGRWIFKKIDNKSGGASTWRAPKRSILLKEKLRDCDRNVTFSGFCCWIPFQIKGHIPNLFDS